MNKEELIIIKLKERNPYLLTCQECNYILEALEEHKKGEWILKSGCNAVCSNCNKENTHYGKYCKWCGSKNFKNER